MEYDIKDKTLHTQGKKRIEWARSRMPVLSMVRERFGKEKPLKNVNIGACLHVTTETAVLAITLKEAGAGVRLCASNPLSTQDDVAGSLVFDYGIEVFAVNGEDRTTYYEHIKAVLKNLPSITLDDGADLISFIHKNFTGQEQKKSSYLPWGSTEETTTGVIRLKALQDQGKLLYPVIAVNDAYTKHLFDNRYGTGQSTIDGIIRATNKLISGTSFVVCGYGWCGRGIASRARGMGANVIICEVNPFRALEAVMDGFRVMPLKQACPLGDIFVTATGNAHVIGKEHFPEMKDRAILANAGHFNVEIDLDSLNELAVGRREVRPRVSEYTIEAGNKTGKVIYVLAEGRLVNLSCAEGHPAEVMDLSFANQALSCEYIAGEHNNMEKKVYRVPGHIDSEVAELKLETMGIETDRLTDEQKQYLSSWEIGT